MPFTTPIPLLCVLLSIHFLVFSPTFNPHPAFVLSQNATCYPGELPEPNEYSIQKIGRYCTQWNEKLSCCSQKSIDEDFWDARESFNEVKVCGIQTNYGSDCELAKWGIRCYKLCATIEDQERMTHTNATTSRFSLCHNMARHIYLRCGDYMECEGGQCEEDPDSLDGCVFYKDKYDLKSFTEDVLGYHYDDTPDSASCFSGASIIGVSQIGTVLGFLLTLLFAL
mmetsp:Transcript_466/g.1771  ORF Transcript_466/g.1771 Transcript_466/m.1771 type:complete len:225 (+) Transcript_466:3573-4247(+)